ncbi:MAG: DNA/RNA nuclease SfsA [Dictyoglomaceae bacterium]|nr:DNA/RNA nuclease SfsA [Dictyoglomaceae bacterium]
MLFGNLQEVEVIRREKRFRLYVLYKDREELVYLPNPGRLDGIIFSGAKVFVENKINGKRKTRWEAVLGLENNIYVSLNAGLANKIFYEHLSFFPVKVKDLKREFVFGKSRFDFLINNRILVEVKSVTLVRDNIGLFPDAPTKRGSKHMEEMIKWSFEKWVVFVVQRKDAKLVMPYKNMDKNFFNSINLLKERGGTFFAFYCDVSPRGIFFGDFIDVKI